MGNQRIIAAFSAFVLVCVGGLALLRRLAVSDPSAALSGKVDAVISGWVANGVGAGSRELTLVIGDAQAGEDVLRLPASDGGEATLLEKLRALVAGNAPRAVDRPNPFTKAFAKKPGAVAWTFDGFSKTQEAAVIDALARNIVKAHDANAVINIVAQGSVGAAVLKSVKTLEGQVRGGVQVGANSVVLLGMDSVSLQRYDPAYFSKVSRPLNVGEWANLSGPKGMDLGEATVEMFSAKFDGAKLPGRYLTGLPIGEGRVSSSGLPIKLDSLADAIIGVIDKQGGIEQWVSQKQWVEQKQAEELRRQAEEEARRKAEEEARKLAEEEARRQAAVRLAAAEAAKQEAQARKAAETRAHKFAQAAACLAPQPKDRPQGMREVDELLRQAA